MFDKAFFANLIATNDKAVIRALILLNERQTSDEQNSEHTKYLNGRGFKPCHARMGTSMVKFFSARGYLSPKQIRYWRVTDKNGDMRLAIYWRQLAEEAERKAASQACQASQTFSTR